MSIFIEEQTFYEFYAKTWNHVNYKEGPEVGKRYQIPLLQGSGAGTVIIAEYLGGKQFKDGRDVHESDFYKYASLFITNAEIESTVGYMKKFKYI